MNNFLNYLLSNPAALQQALIAGQTGNFASNPMVFDGASQALLQPQNSGHKCNLNLEEHQKYADALVLAGIIDENTGKSIKNKMAAVFRAESGSSAPAGGNPLQTGALVDIAQSEFLKARECLLNYLQNLDVELTLEDLGNIEEVVLELEKTAISRHIKENGAQIYTENPYESAKKVNELAKDRIMTGSLGAGGSKSPLGKNFTRAEIAKMSTAEFIKNEPQINYQLQNGLL